MDTTLVLLNKITQLEDSKGNKFSSYSDTENYLTFAVGENKYIFCNRYICIESLTECYALLVRSINRESMNG